MAKKAKTNGTHQPTLPGVQPLQLRTLSGAFESARTVAQMTGIESCSTYAHLAKRLKDLAAPRNIDALKTLFYALDDLNKHAVQLGNTTLVQPYEHPLVTRERVVEEE